MKKLFTILFISLLALVSESTANIEHETIKQKNIHVGFYGRPNTKSLGILGQSNIDKLVDKMKEMNQYYLDELGEEYQVQMAFHIIYGLATPDAGRRNTYMLRLSHESLMRYIQRAKKEGFKVIIDLQMGANSAKESVELVLDYLQYDHVHLALDPEFKIPKHRRYPPGKYIGHLKAKQLNDAQELIDTYIKQNNLSKKELIVHMFHERMLRNKDEVKKFDNVELIYNIDGHGDPAVKIKIYNDLYSNKEKSIAKSGFKIFYHADKFIMTPKQILGLEQTCGRKIWTQPYYINYQ